MSKETKPSVKRISEITGFSPATVSNALNNKKGVNKETSEKIFKIAEELGYSTFSRSIKSIKFVVFRRNGNILDESSFHPAVIEGVEQEAREHKLETVFVYLEKNSPNYKEQIQKLASVSDSAIILLATEMEKDDFKDFEDCRCPIVLLDGWNDDAPYSSVLIDNLNSASKAVEYLISKGHREIGYIRGDFRIQAFQDREAGYQTTMMKNGLNIVDDYVVTLSTKTEGSYQEMCEWIASGHRIPTAYFVDNDCIALGAIRALKQNGYKVPDDVSVVGFDDITFSAISSPPLSTIHVYKQEMGREAVRRLLSMMEYGDGSRFKVQSCTSFIERESVKSLV